MSTIQDLTNSIKTRTTTVLGSNFKEAGYGIDFLKNTIKGSAQIYAVLPQNITDVGTVTRSVTYNHEFVIRFGNTYINKSLSDANQQQLAIDLLELAKDLYKDLVNTKCGLPGICINVTTLEVEDPINVSESKLVVIEMSFIVRYRELI